MNKKICILIISLFCFIPNIKAIDFVDFLPSNKNISIIETENRYKFYKLVEDDKYYQEVPGNNCQMIDSNFNDWSISKPELKNNRIIEERKDRIDLSSGEYNRVILHDFVIEYLDLEEILLTNDAGAKIPYTLEYCNNCVLKSSGKYLLNKNSSIELKLDKLYSDILQVELRFGKDNNILFWETTLYKDSYPVRHNSLRTVDNLYRVCATTYCLYKLNYTIPWTVYSYYDLTYYRYKDINYECINYKREYMDGYYAKLDGYIKDDLTKVTYYKYKEILPGIVSNKNYSNCVDKIEESSAENSNDLIATNYGTKKVKENYSEFPIFIIGIVFILISLIIICIKMKKSVLNEE